MEITIENQSGEPIYVYGFNYGTPTSAQPVGDGNPLADQGQLNYSLEPNPKMRVYFSHQILSESVEIGKAPDPFNIHVDGSIMYTFIEYDYEPASSQYTIDLSYIDAFSYPVTLTFTNVGNYQGCIEGFEYGFKSLQDVVTALGNQGDYDWSALVWPLTDVKTRWDQYPNGIYRIIGPNKSWGGQTDDQYKIGPWVPTSYLGFLNSLPKEGNQLFGSTTTNWDGWQNLTQAASPSPSDTGYVQALHNAATPDSNGKYGFFCYPKDNTAGEFTWLPESVNCKVTVYSYK